VTAGRRLTVVFTVVIAAAGCASGGRGDGRAGGTSPGPVARVDIHVFQFTPRALSVSRGTTVTFTNGDDIDHTVTSGDRSHPDGRFDDRLGGTGSMATVAFSDPGTFAYHCAIHPGMDATITVL
jgi:plastocyanin